MIREDNVRKNFLFSEVCLKLSQLTTGKEFTAVLAVCQIDKLTKTNIGSVQYRSRSRSFQVVFWLKKKLKTILPLRSQIAAS